MRDIHKRYFLWALVGCAFLLYGCGRTEEFDSEKSTEDIRITLDTTEDGTKEKTTDFSRGDLFTMFEEVNNETVIDFQYGDYNKDGTHEAFVLTDSEGYKLWYLHSGSCELVRDDFGESSNVTTDTLEFSTKKYLLLQWEEDGHPNTLIYTLDNKDSVLEPILSGKGFLSGDSQNNMILRVYAKDEQTDYYLYYNPDEGFKEYGGIPIAQEQFLEFQNSEEILEEIRQRYSGYEVEFSFLYRSNQYMNINWSFYENGTVQYRHTTLQYDDQKVKVTGELEQSGKVEIAHMLELATFPTAFKHPDNRVSE